SDGETTGSLPGGQPTLRLRQVAGRAGPDPGQSGAGPARAGLAAGLSDPATRLEQPAGHDRAVLLWRRLRRADRRDAAQVTADDPDLRGARGDPLLRQRLRILSARFRSRRPGGVAVAHHLVDA